MINQDCQMDQQTEAYVQNTLEMDETCTYDKSRWMSENLAKFSDQFRQGKKCDLDNFLEPDVVK